MLPAIPFLEKEPLSNYTTYRIGGPARFFAEPETLEHLKILGEYLKKSGEAFAFLGNGSNLLIPDEGFPGWVIYTGSLNPFVHFLPGDILQVSAGTLNARALRASAEKGLTGLEYLSGVPGTIGGAVFMNAGTAKGWISENLLGVETFALGEGPRVYAKEALNYSYREQHFLQENELIVSAKFQLRQDDPEKIKRRLVESIQKRKLAQPIELPSCGSVFRNPEGQNAWKVIEDAGLRGKKIGGARISVKHANFIVNEGGATMNDVLALIKLAKEKVKEHTGIELEEEVRILTEKHLKSY